MTTGQAMVMGIEGMREEVNHRGAHESHKENLNKHMCLNIEIG